MILDMLRNQGSERENCRMCQWDCREIRLKLNGFRYLVGNKILGKISIRELSCYTSKKSFETNSPKESAKNSEKSLSKSKTNANTTGVSFGKPSKET